jgi:hypothetical protein
MKRITHYLAISVLILGVVSVAIGIAFVVQGQVKANFIKEAMQVEQITVGLGHEQQAEGGLVDSADEAQKAGDTVREHRRGIASTYDELLGEGRFDPTNPEHLTYAQALNLENYLYLAVTGFGLATVATVSGIVMIVTGIALGITGVTLRQLAKRSS